MFLNEEVSVSRICSDISGGKCLSQYSRDEPLQVRWKMTGESVPEHKHEPDITALPGGNMLDRVVSDIEFLTNTDKQYVDIGTQEGPCVFRNDAADINNNRYKETMPCMGLDFRTDYGGREENNEFETFYDMTTGETTVKLGSYDYIIDTASYFNGEEDSTHISNTSGTRLPNALRESDKITNISRLSSSVQGLQTSLLIEGCKDGTTIGPYAAECLDYERSIIEYTQLTDTEIKIPIGCMKREQNDVYNKNSRDISDCDNGINILRNPVDRSTPFKRNPKPLRPEDLHRKDSVPNNGIVGNRSNTLPSIESFNKHFRLQSSSYSSVTNSTDCNDCRWMNMDDHELNYISENSKANAQPNFYVDVNPCVKGSHEADSSYQTSYSFDNLSSKDSELDVSQSTNGPKIYYSRPAIHSEYGTGSLLSINHNDEVERSIDGDQYGREYDSHVLPSYQTQDLSSPSSESSESVFEYEPSTEVERERPVSSEQGTITPFNNRLFEVTVSNSKRKWKRGCRLWEYIRNLLLDPSTNPVLIKWVDRDEGTFKLVQNKAIAYMWGMKKGNGDMSYEKLSRAMRYYYKKQIFQPVFGKRLVYKFGPCATGWRE